ncbi:hypothetical protein, partial [Streptomyces clavuligerus]|uniref:hypothetical protein n=1 Tax=Streptomyces clavuligerus TaxID=1901 RepID=UPI001E544D11
GRPCTPHHGQTAHPGAGAASRRGSRSSRARPWTGPSSATARAIFTAPETHGLTPEQRERFYATAWAENGYDYTYVATSGVHQAHAGACT